MSSARTLHGLLAAQAERNPDRTALVAGDETLTYGELNARANRLAHRLRRLGVTRDVCAAICLERSLELIVAIHGVLKAGGAYVPIDPAHPIERRAFTLNDCRAPVLITSARLTSTIEGYEGVQVPLDEDRHLPGACPAHNPPDAEPTDLAYVIYTSGSTGRPKGALVEHRSALNCLRSVDAQAPCGPDDVYLLKTNHTFDVSLMEIFGPLFNGGRLVVLPAGDERDPNAIAAAIARHRITHACFVPSMLQLFLGDEAGVDVRLLQSLKWIWVAGEAFSAPLAARVRRLIPGARVGNLYGPTECAIGVTTFELCGDVDGATVPIGRGLPNVSIHLVDDTLAPVPPGTPGELLIGGTAVGRGYLNRPELTAERFVPDPYVPGGRLYRTGDICRERPDGELEFIGRRDHQVKIRGYRIELGEIESRLASHPAIAETAVVAPEDARGERILAAYFVVNRGATAPPVAELRRYMLQSLPEYMVPAAWQQIERFPLTASGKRDLRALPPLQAGQPVRARQASGRSGLARAIADAWASELGIDDIRDSDDFFLLGGHSLAAVRVVARLRTSLGKAMTVGDLYRAPTLGALEGVLAAAPDIAELQPPQSPVRDASHLPLTHDQLVMWLLDRVRVPYLNVYGRRRVAGRVDRATLEQALAKVVAAHAALRCHVDPRAPRLVVQDHCAASVSERDLSSLSREGREAAALASFEELSQHRQWPRGEALVRVRLLHLGADGSELQVCTPHIVSDDVSLGVFFEELAAGYLRLKGERPAEAPETSTSYQTVLRDERLSLARTLEQDICFWEAYAGGTAPIVFPESEVLAPGDPDEAVCVTLPALLLTMLSSVARQQRLGVSDLLQAATLSAVSPFVAASSAAKPVLLSTPVSTRQSMETARTIGLFARYDLLKVDVSEHSADPLALARRVRLAKIETEPHQACPYAVKVASADGRRWRGRVVPELVARAAARAITTFYRGLEFDYRAVLATMRLAGARRAEVRGHALFVNVMSSVIDEPGRSLFGYPLNEPPTMLTERSPVRGVLDVTFLREPNRANNCLVRVTGDLRPGFRQRLGEAIVAALEQTAVKQAESKCEVSLS